MYNCQNVGRANFALDHLKESLSLAFNIGSIIYEKYRKLKRTGKYRKVEKKSST